MGLLSKIFGFKQRDNERGNTSTANYPEEYQQIIKFNCILSSLLKEDRFIARSEYKQLVDEYASLPTFIETLKRSGMLKTYVETNNLDVITIHRFVDTYKQLADIATIPEIIKQHNDNFIHKHIKDEKKYLDNILKECDPNILLDDEQREVVLSN